MVRRLMYPTTLWFVRHGESAANVARNVALAEEREAVDLAVRDVDVPLSARGERQAIALGRWFAEQPAAERPTVVLASPYRRARHTAELMVGAGALAASAAGNGAPPIVLDERLREKELGIFYHLTRLGVERHHPDQWALRRQIGRFYYRPPGGESWCDVALRLRAALHDVAREYEGERVLVVCHQVVVLVARYVLEQLTEDEILAIARAHDVANCSVTSYVRDATRGALSLALFNHTVPLEAEGAVVTTEPGATLGRG